VTYIKGKKKKKKKKKKTQQKKKKKKKKKKEKKKKRRETFTVGAGAPRHFSRDEKNARGLTDSSIIGYWGKRQKSRHNIPIGGTE